MTIDDIMALAHTCCILYSARGEHEGEAWEELRVAIEQALEAATAVERERCAKVCEDNGMYMLAIEVRGTK